MSNQPVEPIREIDGHPVYRSKMEFTERAIEIRKGDQDALLCPLCREPIEPGTHQVYLSNHKLFPNTTIHDECEREEGGPQAAAGTLKALYDECKAAREKFVPLGWMGVWPN